MGTIVLFLAAVYPGEGKESPSGNYQGKGMPDKRNGKKTG